MSIKIAQRRIRSAHTMVKKILAAYHRDEIGGEDLEVQLGYIRNQLDIILDDISTCE